MYALGWYYNYTNVVCGMKIYFMSQGDQHDKTIAKWIIADAKMHASTAICSHEAHKVVIMLKLGWKFTGKIFFLSENVSSV